MSTRDDKSEHGFKSANLSVCMRSRLGESLNPAPDAYPKPERGGEAGMVQLASYSKPASITSRQIAEIRGRFVIPTVNPCGYHQMTFGLPPSFDEEMPVEKKKSALALGPKRSEHFAVRGIYD
ncbi:hypothetical protein PRIPAC_76080 [Pristionchus pacificus]|uniref:Uncharacterized protein n=1 Tax=Pristionchus pacificus TaxID=54126 RepID=A0A2A6CZY5_PRIPA|nr:hypothetical protein PRIPAC_76080 [Pristionchus pacificus]|eukprot:PDM83784.1 hypothetical protein PRIPAC_30271 [Pristionchus pacificus]